MNIQKLVQFMLGDHSTISLSLLAILFSVLLHRIINLRRETVVNWPIIGMLPILANSPRLHDNLTDIFRRYDHHTFMFKGPWFSGMNILFTCNPANANHIFNLNFSNYPKGTRFKEAFEFIGDGIFNTDGDMWAVQRRMAHSQMGRPRFIASVIDSTREKLAQVLIPMLNQMAEGDGVVDLSNVLLRLTFDTTFALTVGLDPGYLAPGLPTMPFAEAVEYAERVMVSRMIVPPAWWKLRRWLRIGMEKKVADNHAMACKFVAPLIQKRTEELKKKNATVGVMKPVVIDQYLDGDILSSIASSKPEDELHRDILFAFLGAGKDTTGAAMVWLFWLLSRNPRAEREILKELRAARARAAPSTSAVVFDFEEVESLVYLHACLCETLRLYPPVPLNYKEAGKDDVLPSGHVVGAGTAVVVSGYSMGRMASVWGEDCSEFLPERWITDKGTIKQEPSYKFLAFHSGARSCLGKNMALAQMKLVTASVIYSYRVEVVGGHVCEPEVSMVLHARNGLMVKLKKR